MQIMDRLSVTIVAPSVLNAKREVEAFTPNTTWHAQRFDIVILDEATQMTEPLSLAALIRARAKHLIIAGDPCQLGPILATPARVTVAGRASH